MKEREEREGKKARGRKRGIIASLGAVGIAAAAALGFFAHQRSLYGMVKPKQALCERVGVTHADGKYHLTQEPFLLEGAKALEELGTKVIKLWFTRSARELYSFASDWGEDPANLVELAQSPYYDEVFRMPFSTYILEAYEFEGKTETCWTDGLTPEESRTVEQQFYDLACYFYEAFSGTGKTFVLQNWEGDNALGSYAIRQEDGQLSPEGQTAFDGMAAWINARQAGVTRARKEHPDAGVVVANAFEVNLIDVPRDRENYEGRVLAVDAVVPQTRCDLYSLSCWGTKETGLETVIADKLQYYQEKAPSSELFGSQNLMLGEFGSPEMLHKTKTVYDDESSEKQKECVRLQLECALKEGVRYAVYWELYCNELRVPSKEGSGELRNEDCSGYWLIRPDGSRTAAYAYLQELLAQPQ